MCGGRNIYVVLEGRRPHYRFCGGDGRVASAEMPPARSSSLKRERDVVLKSSYSSSRNIEKKANYSSTENIFIRWKCVEI